MLLLQTIAYILIEPVADTPNCLYVDRLAGNVLYLFSDVMNMAYHIAVIPGIWFLPDRIINLFLAEHHPWILCQKSQYLKFRDR